MTTLLYSGQAHVFGDDIPLDEGVMPFKYAINRTTEPQALIPHLFETVDPGFTDRVGRGDVVFAGQNFCYGKPHVQGFIAMAALGIGIVCRSMPYKQLRRAVAKGLPVITGAPPLDAFVSTGDSVEVDFATGVVSNISTQTSVQMATMSAEMAEMVQRGGLEGVLRRWLAEHPEQAAVAHSAGRSV